MFFFILLQLIFIILEMYFQNKSYLYGGVSVVHFKVSRLIKIVCA